MAFEFKLPDIGEGVTEGEIVKWLINEGDTVEEDQPIVEIMTDKATVEIASPRAGKIVKRNGGEGEVVLVGSVLVAIDEDGAADVVPIKKEEAKDPSLFTASPTPPRPAVPITKAQGKVLASPATRKLAREMGVQLSTLSGSGPNGRVTREDLLSYGQAGSAAVAPKLTAVPKPKQTVPFGGEERTPLRGIRKKIAEHMVHSKHTAPHFTQLEEVDFTALVELKNKAKPIGESHGVKITYLPFIVQALCATLKEFPTMNASLDDEKGEIVVKHYYNIGIAANTEGGLVVPVVKDADQKSIVELAAEIGQLGQKARAGKLAVSDLQGGTFTITSTGGSGGLMATPIINHPEVAIMGVNRIRKAPVVREGQIVIRDMGHISLSIDHRVVDGAVSAEFIKMLVGYLENPALLLLHG